MYIKYLSITDTIIQNVINMQVDFFVSSCMNTFFLLHD